METQKPAESELEQMLRLQQAQLQSIRAEQAARPMVGDQEPLTVIFKEYENNPQFLNKLSIIASTYKQVRRVRRDGNCFYRALLFSIFDGMRSQPKLKELFLERLKLGRDQLMRAGFQPFVFEDYQQFLEKQAAKLLSEKEVVTLANDTQQSNMGVLFLRFLSSAYLKNNAILYQNYIDECSSVGLYCQTEVQPLDKQADQLPIMALTTYLSLPVRIVYLDANPSLQTLIVPEDASLPPPVCTFLYRPGHYDLLY